MGKPSKNEAINGESELPEPLIQHIQSFLNAKEAAQTTVLSKTWYEAWLTRPNLDFDETHFPRNDELGELFWSFARKTIQRYEESNLKIESLRLIFVMKPCHDYAFAKKLIVKALKMGATHIICRLQYAHGFVLPPDVFGSENLVGLSLEGCTIDLGGIEEDPTVIRCSRLKSLSLYMVDLIGTDGVSNIISSCPLLEELSLSFIVVSDRYIKNLNHKLHNLKFLKMGYLNIDPLFFGDLSSKFPSLQELDLELCNSPEDVLVSSHSLERLSYSKEYTTQTFESRVRFDVPNIRKFTFNGSSIPSVSFKSASRGWESRLSFYFRSYQDLSTLWFCELNKFLTELNQSSIHLSINYYNKESFDYDEGVLEDLPRPIVENLTTEIDDLPSLSKYAIFNGLFRSCRPKIITQDVPQESSFGEDFLCKALVRGMNEKLAMHDHCLFGLHEVEEVSVQLCDEVGDVWHDLPWKTILDASMSQKSKQKMRFHLKWKPEA